MAVSTLARLSEDKVTRQEYLRRQDDILLQNKRNMEYNELKLAHEQLQREASEKDTIIAELRSQLGKN